MPAPTLLNLAKKACLRYHQRITSVAGLPYEMVRPFISKVDNAEQLHEIELNSPQIVGKDEEIWANLIKRDIPKYIRDQYDYEPQDPSGWYKSYKRLKALTAKQSAKAGDALSKAMASSKSGREAPKVVNPFSGPRLSGSRRGFRNQGTTPHSRALAGKSILNDIKGDARVRKDKNRFMISPRHGTGLRNGQTQILQAPARMVEEKMETAERSRKKPMPQQGPPASGRGTGNTAAAASSGLSIVEQRRQANERLKGLGLDSKRISETPIPQSVLGNKRTGDSRQVAERLLMAKKKKPLI